MSPKIEVPSEEAVWLFRCGCSTVELHPEGWEELNLHQLLGLIACMASSAGTFSGMAGYCPLFAGLRARCFACKAYIPEMRIQL